MFTNRLSGIKLSENNMRSNFIEFSEFPMPEQRNLKIGRFSAKVKKVGPYRVIRTGCQPIRLQKSRSVSVAI